MLSSAAITFSPNLDGCCGVLTGQPAATWRGLKWPPVSSCFVRVLSHSPYSRNESHRRSAAPYTLSTCVPCHAPGQWSARPWRVRLPLGRHLGQLNRLL